jgi:putative oxidoreductase
VRRGLDDAALLLLRLGLGLGMALAHGLPKVMDLAAGERGFVDGVARLGFPYPTASAWISALVELVGGAAVALGLFTRPFAGLNVVNMVVAGFVRHKAHLHLLGVTGFRVWTEEQLKAWGRPELALLYLLGFVVLLMMGPGALAIDAMMGGRGKKTPRRKYD